jgi:PAS domain S-box-containing protein
MSTVERDQAELNMALAALRESEERYRSFVQQSSEGIWRFELRKAMPTSLDEDEQIAYFYDHAYLAECNDAMAQMYGYACAEEIMGLDLREFLDPSMPQNSEMLREFTRSGYRLLDAETEERDRHGEVKYFLNNFAGVTRDGALVHVWGTQRDITAQKLAEKALRDSEERFRELFECANDIVYTHDMDGTFTSLNRSGERITGYTRAEALHMGLADVVAPEHAATAREMLLNKLAGTPQTTYEIEIIAKDGRRIPVEVSTQLVQKNGMPVAVLGIARDVTDRKHLEEQLRQSQKMEAVGRLAGGVAHDFNNLLTVITGYSNFLLHQLAPADPLYADAEEIKKAAERAAALTRQLLAFSRRQILQPKVLNLNEIVEELEKMLRRLIGEHIDLRIDLGSGPWRVKADPGQIEQVIVNLAVNARDAMPDGGSLTIETRNVTLDRAALQCHEGFRPGPHVRLRVSDTGYGMDEETLTQIFEPFFTTKEQGKGTGLGLSTVYGIVKQSGGHIDVESVPGRGTAFNIYLPTVVEEQDAEDASAARRDTPGGWETVLLVEDEDGVRTMAREVLRRNGYHVLEARHGGEAIEASRREDSSIDLLVTDMIMPQVSGRELAERLKQAHPRMRVLFMSGHMQSILGEQGVLSDHAAFLEKPFTPDALACAVRRVLDAPRPA